MSIIILDMDNCISDDSWRIKHIDWHADNPTMRYKKYHDLCAFDSAGNHDLFQGEQPGKIVIMTARPVTVRYQTEEWLERNGISFSALYMRNLNEHRPSAEMKIVQLGWLLSDFNCKTSDVIAAYDDRPEVIQAYKKSGIQNAQIRQIHDMCPYTKPKQE